MALRASTQLGPPPQGGGCVSPVNNAALLVTKANATSYTPTGAPVIDTLIPADTIIRCTDEGILKTLQEIVTENGGSIPSSGATNTNTPGVKVKRPNCECTNLSKIKLYNNTSFTGASAGLFRTITFSDGYSVSLGNKWQMLKVGTAGLEFKQINSGNLVANDYVVACQSYGKTQDISSGCLKITNKVNTDIASGMYAYQPETDYPQNSFGTSEMIAAIMLENGVYIFSIPNGGSY